MVTSTTKRQRILGTERTKLSKQLAARYEKGASIRELAEATGRSYGFVHTLLSESGVALRRRGGNTRKQSAHKARKP